MLITKCCNCEQELFDYEVTEEGRCSFCDGYTYTEGELEDAKGEEL